jgi:hypothetical protein
VGVTVGGLASKWIDTVVEPVLPAPSVQEPVTFASLPSGPPYVPEVQELIPEGPPSPENETATGLVYQPFVSGPLANEALTDGGLESLRTETLLKLPPPVV